MTIGDKCFAFGLTSLFASLFTNQVLPPSLFQLPLAERIDALWKQIYHHLIDVSPSIGKYAKTTLFRFCWSSKTME
jgi:hypothetical protein